MSLFSFDVSDKNGKTSRVVRTLPDRRAALCYAEGLRREISPGTAAHIEVRDAKGEIVTRIGRKFGEASHRPRPAG